MAEKELYSIGRVGKICDVSSRTLRYYEEVGLLKPDKINEQTGYRYYSGENMYRVQVIRYLSDEGFSLDEVRDILGQDDLVRLRDIFADKIEKTRETIDYFQRRAASLQAWLDLFVEGDWVQRHNGMTPTAKYIPVKRYLCYEDERVIDTAEDETFVETSYKAFSKLGGRAMVEVGGALYVKFGSYQARMEGKQTQVAFLEQLQPGRQRIENTILMGGFTAVTGYHLGSLETVGETYEKVAQWARENDFTLRGDACERRVINAYSVSRSDLHITEILLPVEEDVSGFSMYQGVEKR